MLAPATFLVSEGAELLQVAHLVAHLLLQALEHERDPVILQENLHERVCRIRREPQNEEELAERFAQLVEACI